MTDTKMTFDEFLALAEAYGGEIGRWPEERRVAASRLTAEDSEAAAALSEARALDVALDLDVAPAPSADLMARVLGDAAQESVARAATAAPAARSAVRPRASTGVGALLGRLGFGSGALVAAGLGAAVMAGLAVGVIAPVGGAQAPSVPGAGGLALDEFELEEMELLELAVVDALFDGDDDMAL